MSAIVEKHLVHAPLGSAERTVRQFLTAHSGADGVARIFLQADPDGHRYPAIVTLRTAHRSGDMTPRFSIRWLPEGDDPHPSFEGELSVRADDDYNSFTLVLDGRPIAAAETAHELLADMANEIEAQIGKEECAKHSPRPVNTAG